MPDPVISAKSSCASVSPPEWNDTRGHQDVTAVLKAVNARMFFYDHLIDNAQKSYADYLEGHKNFDRLWDIFKSIDDFVPAQ